MADGEKVDKKKSGAIGCLVLVGIVLTLAMCAGGGEKEKVKPADEASAIPVTAEGLFNAYASNEARAQQQYGDKVLKVTGKVASIDLGLGDKPTIALVSPNEFMPVTINNSDSVTATATRLNKGDDLSAICTDVSEMAGRPYLDGCTIK
ncbi:MAG: OB-fold protein [Sphingobium sp.]